jgi:glutaredoxin 3
MATEARVKELIAGNKVMVFSKSFCPYCTKAKKALSQFTNDYKVLEV